MAGTSGRRGGVRGRDDPFSNGGATRENRAVPRNSGSKRSRKSPPADVRRSGTVRGRTVGRRYRSTTLSRTPALVAVLAELQVGHVNQLFEWDPVKAVVNGWKHGVTFNEAATVFGDPLAVQRPDPDHSAGEKRYLLLGTSARGRLLVVAFVDRPPRTRLISARRATSRERSLYEEEG